MVAEYVGRFNTMAALAGTSTILILTLWIAGNNVPSTIAFSVVFGFTTGSTISLGPSMIFQISELRAMSHNLSLLYGMQSVAALVVSPLGGALLAQGHRHGPLYLQLFAGLIMGSGTFFIVLARLQQSGLALRKKI
jgi:MFS family permease